MFSSLTKLWIIVSQQSRWMATSFADTWVKSIAEGSCRFCKRKCLLVMAGGNYYTKINAQKMISHDSHLLSRKISFNGISHKNENGRDAKKQPIGSRPFHSANMRSHLTCCWFHEISVNSLKKSASMHDNSNVHLYSRIEPSRIGNFPILMYHWTKLRTFMATAANKQENMAYMHKRFKRSRRCKKNFSEKYPISLKDFRCLL